jgi:hypothetical protein
MSEALHPEQVRARDYLVRKGTLAPLAPLRMKLRETFAKIEGAFDSVAAEERDRVPAPGKWSPREILDHLVLSHGPAIPQMKSLLSGVSPEGVAVPAGLHRPHEERPSWAELRVRLGEIHRQLTALLDQATDDLSLEPKAVIEMVIKVDDQPRHWFESIDWKALTQAIRVHTLEHDHQLQRTLTGIRET